MTVSWRDDPSTRQVDILTTSALWYAWGRIDGDAQMQADGFDTEHGQQFATLYGTLAALYANETRTSRPSVLDAWARFVQLKRENGVGYPVTVDLID